MNELVVPMLDLSGPWTRFWDMGSGGGHKEDWSIILIQAPQNEAERIFYNRFGHNPHRVTCTCCGPDYSIDEYATLAGAIAFHLGWDWGSGDDYVERPNQLYRGPFRTLRDFLSDPEHRLAGRDEKAFILLRGDIVPEWRHSELPEQGYVWVD